MKAVSRCRGGQRGPSIVIYWVAYWRGSFSLKERYASPEDAYIRCAGLQPVARAVRIVESGDDQHPFLPKCIELPPVVEAKRV